MRQPAPRIRICANFGRFRALRSLFLLHLRRPLARLPAHTLRATTAGQRKATSLAANYDCALPVERPAPSQRPESLTPRLVVHSPCRRTLTRRVQQRTRRVSTRPTSGTDGGACDSSACPLLASLAAHLATSAHLLLPLHRDAHEVGWVIAGATAAVSTVITLCTVYLHAHNYTKPKEQRQILRILLMPAVYASTSACACFGSARCPCAAK